MDKQPRPLVVALSGLAALAVAMGIGRFAFTPLLPMMQGDLGLTVAQGGWLASANYAGYLVGALSAMWVRAGAATVVRGSLVLITAVTIAMGLTGDFVLWMILRAAAGIASAWALVFVSVWCLDRLSRQGHPALGSAVFSGVGAGVALAGLLCLALMQMHATASQAWVVLGVAACMLTAMLWPVFGARATASAPSGGAASSGRYRWTRDGMLLVVCYGIYGFGYIIPATFVPAMAKQIISDPAVFGWSWPLFGLSAVVATLLTARFAAPGSNRRVWVVCALVMAAGVAAPAVSPGIVAIMVAAICVGATFVIFTMVGMQEARIVGGAHAKTLMAAMTAAFAAGQIAGPLAVSAFAAPDGSMNAVLIAAAVLLVGSAAAIGFSTLKEGKPVEALPE